jgi:hypothetical protein
VIIYLVAYGHYSQEEDDTYTVLSAHSTKALACEAARVRAKAWLTPWQEMSDVEIEGSSWVNGSQWIFILEMLVDSA